MRARRSAAAPIGAALVVVLGALAGCSSLIGADFDKPFQAQGGSGQGSGGGSAGCQKASDCAGADGECGHRACKAGLCAFEAVAEGTAIAAQTTGDCAIVVCDGKGGTVTKLDANDTRDDQNDCTLDTCEGSTPTSKPVAAGKACGPDGSLACDASGQCTGCTKDDQCGAATACTSFHCDLGSNVCQPVYEPAGKPVSDPTKGDCHGRACNGSGSIDVVVDDGDVPPDKNGCERGACQNGAPKWDAVKPQDDGTSCTVDTCDPASGATVHTPVADWTKCPEAPCGACKSGVCGTHCGQGKYCNGSTCVNKVGPGGPCAFDWMCGSGHCADGVCCNDPCKGFCEACVAKWTNAADGTCAPVTAGTDPQQECPQGDSCNGAGACHCSDGKKDLGETGVDCGGTCAACPSTWQCDCNTAYPGDTCCKSQSDCSNCANQVAQCSAQIGKTCADGAGPQGFQTGDSMPTNNCGGAKACAVVVCQCKP